MRVNVLNRVAANVMKPSISPMFEPASRKSLLDLIIRLDLQERKKRMEI